MKRRPLRPSLRELTRVTPLRRRKRLKSASRLRCSPLPPVNPERLAKLREQQFGAHSDAVREMRCTICNEPPPSDPSHIRARGMGGVKGRWWHLVPMCRPCHLLWHQVGEASVRSHGWSRRKLLVEAARLAWQSHDLGIVPAPGIPRPIKGAI